MVVFREVTETEKREGVYPYRYVPLPALTKAAFGTPEYDKWVNANRWMVNYSVFMDDKPKAVKLARELDAAFNESSENPTIPGIIAQLQKLRTSSVWDDSRGTFYHVEASA